MQNFFLTRILKYMAGKLEGYKTLIAGIGTICMGIAHIIPIMFPDIEGLPKGDMEKGMSLILGGLALLGIGGKIEKNTKAVDNQKDLVL